MDAGSAFLFSPDRISRKNRLYYEIKSKEECFMKDAFMKTFGGTMGVIVGFVAGITVSANFLFGKGEAK